MRGSRIGLAWACAFLLAAIVAGTTVFGPFVQTTGRDAAHAVAIDRQDVVDHYIGDDLVIRTADFGSPDLAERQVILSAVIAPDGQVLAATPKSGPQKFFAEAERIALTRRFKPFEQNGAPIFARFDLPVFLWPLEKRPATQVAFPEIQDWDSVWIRLSRQFYCSRRCAQYTIEVHGDGTVVYEGLDSVAIYGTHRARISRDAVRELINAFREANFFWTLDEYPLPPDTFLLHAGGWETLCLSIDGKIKAVAYQPHPDTGLPDSIVGLGSLVDAAVGVKRWSEGNQETLASLRAENWDASSPSIENRRTLIGTVGLAPQQTAIDLIDSGFPIDGRIEEGTNNWTAFDAAVSRAEEKPSDEVIVQALIRAALRKSGDERDDAVWQAAFTGRADIVRTLLSSGANPHYRDGDGISVLDQAVRSASPAVVAAVLESKPDVNARSASGLPPLHWVFYDLLNEKLAERAEIVRMLVAAGADVTVRDDNEGETTLGMNQYSAEIAIALIAGGADVNARNGVGFTPLMGSKSAELTKVLLEAGADPWIEVEGVSVYEWAHRKENYYPEDALETLDAYVRAHPKSVKQ